MAAHHTRGLVTTTRDDWAFLQPWIDVLEGRLTASVSGDSHDRVRVGEESSRDLWIQVALSREEQLQIHRDGDQAGLALLREAVVMVHLLGVANYELWYKWLVMETQIYSPPQWFIHENDKIPMRHAFVFTEEHDQGFMDWDHSLRFLLGNPGFSDEFKRDLTFAKGLLARHGIDWEELEAIPVKSTFRSNDFGDVHIQLNGLARAVVEMEKLATGARQSFGDELSALFKVTELELDLGGEVMTPLNFQALDQLLRLGIPVGLLRLPNLPLNAIQEERLASLKDIAGFFRTMLGITADRGRLATQVHRLVMPFYYSRTRWFAPFCSALASSRFLRVLHLAPNATGGMTSPGFGAMGDVRRRAWSWLAFALLSSASSTSVQELILTGSCLLDADVDVITAIIESSDPIAQLDQLPHENIRSGFLANRFLADRRASLESVHQSLRTNKRPRETNDQTVQAKRQRVDARESSPQASGPVASALQVIQFTADSNEPESGPSESRMTDTGQVNCILRLLRSIGPRLRGVSLESRAINTDALQKLFTCCPSLDSLAVRVATTEPLEDIYDAYRTSKLSLSSLKLSGVSIGFERMLRMVIHLERHSEIEATPARLQVAVHSDGVLTRTVISRILQLHKTLTHLHLIVPHGQRDHFEHELRQKHHGQVITSITATERRRRLVFLSVLSRLAQSNPQVEMDADTKALVLQFATPRPHRRIVTISRSSLRS